MKKCRSCKVNKAITKSDFYVAKANADGFSNQCKTCYKESVYKRRHKLGVEHLAWQSMRSRCYNKNRDDYKHYGGRGIKVCDRWLKSYDNFIKDMGKKPEDSYSLDRVDNNGDYSPENCRWSDIFTQRQNRRIHNHNKTGYSGVFWSKQTNNWLAGIGYKGKQIVLGRYEDIEDAIEARKQAELKYWNKQNTL